MPPSPKNIALIGFKHVGKTAVGKQLAKKLNKKWIDLDQEIEKIYYNVVGEALTCRQIVQQKGEDYFRTLDTDTLTSVIQLQSVILSVGGGTPLQPQNQHLLKSALLIHLTASKEIVFERILATGRPTFVDPDEDMLTALNRLWDQRIPIYEKIKDFSIENKGAVDQTVNHIMERLNYE